MFASSDLVPFFPLPVFLQVDKVCGHPEEKEVKSLPDSIIQAKEIERPPLTMAHSITINNKRR